MAPSISRRQKTPGAYRKGSSGRQTREGESPRVVSDPLVSCEVAGSETSRKQQREKDPRRGRHHLEHVEEEDAGGQHSQEKGLYCPAPEAGLHSEEERKTSALGHSDDARSGDAGALRPGIDPDCRDHGGPELLCLSGIPLLRRCDRAVLHQSRQEMLAVLHSRGGYSLLF